MVNAKRKINLAAEIQAGSHTLVSGLNAKLGGNDEGPNPHELLEAALAACTILTAQMYAQRKGIALDSTDVEVKIVSEGAETQISRKVSFRGNLTDEQKSRLSEIVGKCPIHKLLESHVTVETSIT